MATEVNELRIEAKTESLARAESDLNKVAAAQQRVATTGDVMATATDKAVKRQVDASASLDRLRKSVDDAYKAEQAFAAGQRTLDRNLAQGNLSQQDHARLLDLLQVKYGVAQTANDNFSRGAAAGAKLTSYEMTNLGRQVNDMATMLASGSSPFQIIATQSGQVYDVLANSKAGLGGAVKQLGSGLLGLLTPARIAMGGMALIGGAAILAYSQWNDAQVEIQRSLSGIGRASGATVGQINQVAEAYAELGGVSQNAAREMASAAASTGRIGPSLYGDIITTSKEYSKIIGTDAVDASRKLAEALADPSRGVETLNAQLGAFDAATVARVRSLDAQNRTWEAQRLILGGVAATTSDAQRKTATWSATWDALGRSVSNVWAGLGKAIDIATGNEPLERQKAALEARLAQIKKAQEDEAAHVKALQGFGYNSDQIAAEIPSLGALDGMYKEITKSLAAINEQLAKGAQQAKDFAANADSLKVLGQIKIVMPEIDAKQALLDRAELLKGVTNDPVLLEKLGLTKDVVALAAARAKQASDSFISETDRAVKSAQLAQQAINARSPTEKASLAARQKELDLANSALSPEEKQLQIRLAYNTALAQSTFQLTEAQRQRVESAEQGVASQELEIQLIGKTAGEQALMRANFASWWALRQEAAQNGTAMNLAEYQQLVKINEVMAQRTQLAAQARLQDEAQFQRDQLGRSTTDQAIAAQQRSMGLPVDLNSAEASAMRFTATLSDMKGTADSALSGFINDLRNGKSATEALRNAMNRLLDDLIKMASNQAVSGLMQGLMGLTGTSGFGGSGSAGIGSIGSGAGFAEAVVSVGGFHTGGVPAAGESSFVRTDHPALYAGAPRFHTGRDPYGLLSGERRAIVKDNEGIFTPAQMRALGARMGGGDTISQVFAPVIHIGAAAQGGGGVSSQELMQTLEQWWKSQRADVLNVVRDARSRRVPGV